LRTRGQRKTKHKCSFESGRQQQSYAVGCFLFTSKREKGGWATKDRKKEKKSKKRRKKGAKFILHLETI